MLVNSLFLDFLLDNGLSVYKDGSTRDVICLEFNYGTRSYQEEINHLHKNARKFSAEYKRAKLNGDKYVMDKARKNKDKTNQLVKDAYKNKALYQKRGTQEVRKLCYANGVSVTYNTYNKSAEIIKSDTIHYKMLYRSTGKAKKGTCTFIRDELFDIAKDFLYMGIKLPEKNAKIVEVSAYAPLVSSGIVGRVKIHPENILILDDVERFFTRDIISVETDKDKHCSAKWIDSYELKNTLFDGQALIDTSIFPEWANGYVLLRHHFTKMAAFHANIQMFFQDWCRQNGWDYNTKTVEDFWGNEHFLKDVELITTVNAVKWIKMDISYEYWCEWVHKNDCMFGVVKYSHPSKLGKYQKMSYQIVNSLNIDTMHSICKDTLGYIQQLKDDDEVFQDFLRKKSNFSNDYDVLLALCNWNPDFLRCSYYRERKKRIISNYLYDIKCGALLQYGDNLTIVGSPYAMLLYAANGNKDDCDLDDTLKCEPGTIQCFTYRFEDGEYLAGFRSPFNGRFNMSFLHNVQDERIKKYFNFSPQIIAVNMIGTDFQDRNNGSDQDSDSLYVTDQADIVNHARTCYRTYPTIVNNIPKDNNTYNSSMADYALMDNLLAGSQRDIGESSNIAQIAQTYSYCFDNPKYNDYVAELSVLAQAAIDSAKRRFDIDIAEEISRIKKDMDIDVNGYPMFWKTIKKGFDSSKINHSLRCPMNYLQQLKIGNIKSPKNSIELGDFLVDVKDTGSRRRNKKVEELIEKYSLMSYSINSSNDFENIEQDEYLLLRSDFSELIDSIRSVSISKNYQGMVYWLINRAFLCKPGVKQNHNIIKRYTDKNRSLLLKVLYEVNPDVFLSCFLKDIVKPNSNNVH